MHAYFSKELLTSRIPCSITLRLPYKGGLESEPLLYLTLHLAPGLDLQCVFSFRLVIEEVTTILKDQALHMLIGDWIRDNHDVLLSICNGDYDSAHSILRIDIECGGPGLSMIDMLGPPVSPAERALVEGVRLNMALKQTRDANYVTHAHIQSELRRLAIIKRHRTRFLFGLARSVAVIY